MVECLKAPFESAANKEKAAQEAQQRNCFPYHDGNELWPLLKDGLHGLKDLHREKNGGCGG